MRWLGGRGRFLGGVVVATVLVLTATLSGCSILGGTMGAKDAAGLTLVQVEKLSLEEQFDLVGQRAAKMEVLLTEAQEQISTDVWRWIVKDAAPTSGVYAVGVVAGATSENSYKLDISRAIELPGAVGARADLEPMIAYFESKGWEATVAEHAGGDILIARANTGEGYWVAYRVQPNGWYSIEVYSEMFWGDYGVLLQAITSRIPLDKFNIGESVPGVYIDFPKWSDSVRVRDPLNQYPDEE